MKNIDEKSLLKRWQKIFLLLVSFCLAALLLFFRGGLSHEAPLEELASNSPSLEASLVNDNPTILEFYADWCEACRQMAPAMLQLSRDNKDKIDFIFLNVDNTLWRDLLVKYQVNGIPQLNFFDRSGESIGKSLGLRTSKELQAITAALLNEKPLPEYAEIGIVSEIKPSSEIIIKNQKQSSISSRPRSHG